MANKLDELLEARGLKFEDLHKYPGATEQYLEWLELLETQPMSVDDVKRHIKQEKAKVELELVDTDEFIYYFGIFKVVNRKHVGLKARLKNYLLLELLLESPDTKRRSIEAYIDKLIKIPTTKI